MSSWLKVAEDLLEVVDRRAKLVAGDAGDAGDEPDSVASQEPSSEIKRRKERSKTRKKVATKNFAGVVVDKRNAESFLNPATDKATDKKDESSSSSAISKENSYPSHNDGRESSTIYLKDSLQSEVGEVIDDAEVLTTDSKLETADTSVSHTPVNIRESDKTISQRAETEQLPKDKEIDADKGGYDETKMSSSRLCVSKDDFLAVETPPRKKLENSKNDVQEQMEEANILIKTTNSNGQSKEARLARICNNLSNRLQEYKSENSELEKLLASEKELVNLYEARIEQLLQELSRAKVELARVESNMLEALATKNLEIETLVNSSDSLKKKLLESEASLASIQANMESIMRNRELTETRIVQALREELSSAERRAEEERAAHSASKLAAREREAELECRAVEATSALAKIQRMTDERTAKAAELEQKVALLEVECASLNQELQDMESRARRGQKKSQDDTSQSLQMQQIQAWQSEVERARQSQRDAENKLSILEAEVQKLRVETAAMKRDAEHYSRQEHMELEKRYGELTDLLYNKQTQLQALASEKAAVEFQLEKEVKRVHEAQVETERIKGSRRSSWDEETEMKSLDTLPVYQRHMVGASVQLQKAVKMLDSGAARATRFLWRYPTARLILLFYLVFVHSFLMYLLHRLQEKLDPSIP